jgi:hypothetical protein
MLNNKKAITGETIVTVLFIIGIILVLILFYYFIGFNLDSAEKRIISSQSSNTGDIILISYISTPYNSTLPSVQNIGDLIAMSLKNNDYNNLDKTTTNIFSMFGNCYIVTINEHEINGNGEKCNYNIDSDAIVPGYDGNINVKLRLQNEIIKK